MYRKQIKYDRSTKDFEMTLDGRHIGYARTHLEAEITLDHLVYELLKDGYFPQSAKPKTVRLSGDALASIRKVAGDYAHDRAHFGRRGKFRSYHR